MSISKAVAVFSARKIMSASFSPNGPEASSFPASNKLFKNLRCAGRCALSSADFSEL